MIEEIRFVKRENMILNKRLFQIENDLKIKDKEIKDINTNIVKYDLNNVNIGKSSAGKLEKIKNNYVKKESKYILTIYQLEKELKQISEALNKNKIDRKSFEELKVKYNFLKTELNKDKADFKEYEFQNDKKVLLLTQYNSELSQKINALTSS